MTQHGTQIANLHPERVEGRKSHIATRLGALIVAVVPLVVYVLTLQNGLTPGELRGGDPITHQYAQATLRFANAPGYPIFTMLGWLWFQLSAWLTPFFNPVERLTFYSTLYAIPALVVLYYLLLKVQQDRRPLTADRKDLEPSAVGRRWSVSVATLATLYFAFTYFFWFYAISSENYSSGVLLTLLMIALAWRWQERRDEATLLWLCFVCGLSLAHLLTVALAVPAVIVFVVGQQRDYLRRPKLLAKIVAVTFLPLLSYAYVYWRGAEHPEWRGQGNWPNAWSWFVDFLKTQQGQAELTWSWDGVPWEMLRFISNELTVIVFIGGLVGLWLLPRWRAVLLLGIVAVYAPELYVDRYGNWFQTITALYPVFVIGFAALCYRTYVLLSCWWENVIARSPAALSRDDEAISTKRQGDCFAPLAMTFSWQGSSRLVAVALLMLLVLLTLNRLVGNFAADNLRDRPNATGLTPGWALLADDPERNAHIVGTYDENLALDYLTKVWGARPDVQPLGANQIGAALGQPLYASRAAMPVAQKSLAPSVRLSSHGLNLIALSDEPSRALPSSATAMQRALAHGLELAGHEMRRDPTQQRVTLYWRAAQPIDVDMSVSVRLMRGEQIVAQTDSAHPVGGFYPMTRWLAGEVVRDDYALPRDGGTTADRVHVILYRATVSGFENLAEFDVALR
ncbi:MAG: DUF2723 domain-containing protein [Chloroflexota bacterium]